MIHSRCLLMNFTKYRVLLPRGNIRRVQRVLSRGFKYRVSEFQQYKHRRQVRLSKGEFLNEPSFQDGRIIC
jgi:hypothetical protein